MQIKQQPLRNTLDAFCNPGLRGCKNRILGFYSIRLRCEYIIMFTRHLHFYLSEHLIAEMYILDQLCHLSFQSANLH